MRYGDRHADPSFSVPSFSLEPTIDRSNHSSMEIGVRRRQHHLALFEFSARAKKPKREEDTEYKRRSQNNDLGPVVTVEMFDGPFFNRD